MDRPAGGCGFLVFPLLMLLNCPPYMCHTLNPLNQLHKKWILRIVLKISFIYCSLNSAKPYTFKHLNNGGSIQNDKTDSKCEFFKGGTNASTPASSFTAKTMRHFRHSSTAPPLPMKKQQKRKKNVKCYHTHIK